MSVKLLHGNRILVLNWRDVRHPQAGGAEQYMHEIARRWVEQDVHVTWLTARAPGAEAREMIDGIEVLRTGGALSVYPRAAAWMATRAKRFDAVVDCQNGIPFFAPLFAGAAMPVVQVVHHVHQDQFATHFSRPMAAVGRFLEGPASRAVYGRRAIAAVSPSTREELRRRLGLRGPISIVPNGTHPVLGTAAAREPGPVVTLVTRLVPHKRVDLLLDSLVTVLAQIPDLKVNIVGGGSELAALTAYAERLGLDSAVTFHGRQPDSVRDDLLSKAWLTTSTSAGEGWGCSILEAAAWGVPCLALKVPGVRDSVVHEHTGWLVDRAEDYAEAMVTALRELADPVRAEAVAQRCRSWAACFSWDRSAELLAAVLAYEIGAVGSPQRREARSDITTVATLPDSELPALAAGLRATDEVRSDGRRTGVLLGGCDEVDAMTVLDRLGVSGANLRLANRYDLLAGPLGAPGFLTAPAVPGLEDPA
ncbi:glycosyltransferase family 4 protein [Kutzneria viridogrisea]|uniref:Glycosyltransferase involved in cell wall biosynthesis n=1 Tax=Kutzneria viridogrisea TaxID=47990 RepID=A0ABR6BFX3_9PSEU|nr:glycosyltransferase involved in cell wall biosynthesis [Kutzneria viridogrisea]